MFIKILIALLLIFVCNIKSSFSQNENDKVELISIAAIVNDEPVTIMDLNNRMQLIIVSSNLPNNLETKKNLYGQALQSLINEKLQSQEAEKLQIKVTSQELASNIKFIEKNNNMEENTLIDTLYKNGVSKSALPSRLLANLILEKLLRKVIQPKVLINNNEIDNEYNNYLSNEGKYEYQFSEIIFNYTNLSENTDTILIAKQIRKKIIKDNNFEVIARRINENGTGKFKKDNNWRLENNINTKTYGAIKDLKINGVSELILLNTGVSIIKVDDKRKIIIPDLSSTVEDISFISFNIPINKNRISSFLEEIRSKTINIKSCNEMTEVAKNVGNKKGKYIGKILLKSLPEHFIKNIKNIEVNEPTLPILAEDGIYIVMICDRNTKLNQEFALKEMIKNNIKSRSTNILKERYLLDLNRKALIDIRMQ
ncbi:SurA N-terminal domain-containing protein [Alphaproteobacteria bacterium]|nr:SurA N-terminal domain-containing protein [Alphaproteobacteria bacterium]